MRQQRGTQSSGRGASGVGNNDRHAETKKLRGRAAGEAGPRPGAQWRTTARRASDGAPATSAKPSYVTGGKLPTPPPRRVGARSWRHCSQPTKPRPPDPTPPTVPCCRVIKAGAAFGAAPGASHTLHGGGSPPASSTSSLPPPPSPRGGEAVGRISPTGEGGGGEGGGRGRGKQRRCAHSDGPLNVHDTKAIVVHSAAGSWRVVVQRPGWRA